MVLTKIQLYSLYGFYMQVLKINMVIMDISFYNNELEISDRTFFTIVLREYKKILITNIGSIISLDLQTIGNCLKEEGYRLNFQL